MSQRIYWQYKDEDSTYDLNVRQTGIIPFGRYKGFDPVPDGMGITLKRNTTPATRVELDLSTTSISVWVTRQGAVVTEDGNINLPLSNGDATHPRIDIIVGTHNHVESTGGIAATYSIVEGTPAAEPVAPDVLNDTTDVILGYLTIPAGATEVAEEMYTYARIPDFADDATITHLDKIQKFAATQFMHSMYMDVGFGGIRLADNSLHLGIAGNIFSANYLDNADAEYFFVEGVIDGTAPSGYIPIESLTFAKPRTFNPSDPPKAQRKVIYSQYPLEIRGWDLLRTPNNNSVFVEPYTPLIFEQITGNTNFAGGPGEANWFLVNGAEVTRSGVNKVTGLISHAYETATVNTGDNSLPRDSNQPRNIIRLTDAGGVYNLEFIQSQAYTQNGGAESGTTLTIYPYDNDLLRVTVESPTSTTPPLGYKPIRNSSGGNIYVKGGPLVVQEMDDYFEIIGGAQLRPIPVTLTSGLFSTSGNKGRVVRGAEGFLFFDGFADLTPASNVSANSLSVVWSMPLILNAAGQEIYRMNGASWVGVLFEENGSGVVLGTYPVMLVCVDGRNVRMDYHPALSTSKRYVLFLNGMRVTAFS